MKQPNLWTAMRVAVILALATGVVSGAHAVTDPNTDSGKDDSAPGMVVKNDAPGWMWYGMVPYENALLPDGAAHAGGPGTYAMYTFQGSGVDVYGMRSLTVVADKRTHRTGKVKVSIDDAPQATIDLGSSTIDYHAKIFSVTGLSGGNHVIQITPVDGWVVVDSLVVTAGGGDPETSLPSAADIIGKSHLVGYWSCANSAGSTLADKSGHQHTGTLQAGAVVTKDGAMGKRVVSFPQAGGVEIMQPVVDTTKSFTATAWVKMDDLVSSNHGFQTFVSIDGEEQSGFYLQKRGDTGRFALTMHPLHADSTTTPIVGRWYFIAGVYDAPSTTLAIFVDGALEGTARIPAPAHANGNTAFGRAKFSGNFTDFVAGSIGDVRMYDAALLPPDIAALYSAGM